jgi:acetyltransferase-like isoleucine patch superfamily enzyme
MSRGIEIDCTGNVEIGEHCVLSEGVKIYSHTHDFNEGWVADITREKGIRTNSITIGDNVSIGTEAMILPQAGVIEDNAVIGARAVVTKPIGRCEFWAGNPARKIGERPQPER